MAFQDALGYWVRCLRLHRSLGGVCNASIPLAQADWEEMQRETEQALVPPARLFDSSIRREALDFEAHGLTMLCRDFVLSDPAREFVDHDLDQRAMEVPLPEADASPTEKPGFATPADGDADPPGDLDAYVQRLAQRRRREAQLSAGRQRFVGRMQTLLEMQPAASDGADGGAHE